MTQVLVRMTASKGSDWNPSTHSGWPGATARMIAVTSMGNLVFAFPYAPKAFQYSNVADDYVTIDRPANYPLIEWRARKLSQVSFSFLVAHRPSHGVISVESQMEFLNRFVALKAPIMFTGMGPHLNSIIRPGDLGSGVSGLGNTRAFRAWRVTDFSYSTRDVLKKGDMTQVECQITLTEDRNPDIRVTTLPMITYTYKPVEKSTASNSGSGPVAPTGTTSGYSTIRSVEGNLTTAPKTTTTTTDYYRSGYLVVYAR